MNNEDESKVISDPELTQPRLTRPTNLDEGKPRLTAPQFTKPTYGAPDMSRPEESLPDPFTESASEPEVPTRLDPLFSSPSQKPVVQPAPTLSTPQNKTRTPQALPDLTLSSSPAPRPIPSPTPTMPSSHYSPPPEKKSNTGKIILALVLLLLLCCCLGGMGKWLWDNGDELIGYTSMVWSYMRLV